jgi:hypothetical protein
LPTSPPTEFTLTVKKIQPIESKQPQPQNTIQTEFKQEIPISESNEKLQPQNTIQTESKQEIPISESKEKPQPQNTIQTESKQDITVIDPKHQNTIQTESKQDITVIDPKHQNTIQTDSKNSIPIIESKPNPLNTIQTESAQEIPISESNIKSSKRSSQHSKRRIKNDFSSKRKSLVSNLTKKVGSKRFSILSKQISEQVSVDYGSSSNSGESGKHSDHFYSNQSSEDRYSHDDMMDKEMKFLDTVARNVRKEVNHLKTLPKGERDGLLGALNH